MLRMNYLNERNEMEEVCVMGYFGDSSYTSTTHAECYQDGVGYFAAPFTKLYANSNTVKDILDVCAQTERLYEIMNKVVNKGE